MPQRVVEVVVAMVILGLAVPPLIIQIGASAKARAVATAEQNAAQLANDRISDIFGINLTLRGSANLSDVSFGSLGAAQAIAWTKLEAFAGLLANW